MADDGRRRLLDEARDGSETAWHTIVTELGPSVAGYARAKGLSEPDDLMQEVFMNASMAIDRFNGDWDDFRAWLFTIAYRRIADAHRRAYRTGSQVSIDTALAVAESRNGPDQAVMVAETTKESIAALDILTPIEREVVLLRIIGEMDSDEVAHIVGKRAGTVRVIQSRAIAKLRRVVRD